MTTSFDRKLVHLVGKAIPSGLDLATHNFNNRDFEVLVEQLRLNHREYERRNLSQFTLAVVSAVSHLQQSCCERSRKRKQPVVLTKTDSLQFRSDSDEDEYDRAAAIRDAAPSVNRLNDSILRFHRPVTNDEKPVSEQREANSTNEFNSEVQSEVTVENTQKLSEPLSSKEVLGTVATYQLPPEPPEASSTVARRTRNRRVVRQSSSMTAIGNDSTATVTPTLSQLAFTVPVQRPAERYTDLGGMDGIITTIRQLVEYPITRPEIYRHLGVDPPRGVLLRGPPGTGKTHLANAVAGQLGVPFFRVSAPELVAGVSGESELRIRSLFQAASDAAPAIIFLDEIDAVAPSRGRGGGDSGRGMEKRMVAQLLTSMDQLSPENNRNQQAVLVLAATNRPDALDPALRRAGRFDKEILLGVPDEDAREKILRSMTKGMRLQGQTVIECDKIPCQIFDFKLLARKTPGFVGADIRSLTKEAAVVAINRIFQDVLKDDSLHPSLRNEEVDLLVSRNDISSVLTPLSADKLERLFITMDDFLAAIPMVQPSSQREGFATIPDVSWDDIGALQCIREELSLSVLEPIRSPEKFKALGLQLPAGVLLYGPPGCGKTLLAKAIARESGANFISVKGPELLDKYVGESERAVRLVFDRARSSSPCIVFFDELDSLVPRRGSDHGGGGGVSERVVNQLLTEMDGLESRRSVFVIAATNRPELIDPAMMRPGRLDKLLYVPLPTSEERAAILRTLGAKVKTGHDVDLGLIGRSPRAEGYSGADLAALLREAGLAVLKEHMTSMSMRNPSEEGTLVIRASHFDAAFSAVMPSVSKRDHARYNAIRDRMARARSRGVDSGDEIRNNKEGVSDDV